MSMGCPVLSPCGTVEGIVMRCVRVFEKSSSSPPPNSILSFMSAISSVQDFQLTQQEEKLFTVVRFTD